MSYYLLLNTLWGVLLAELLAEFVLDSIHTCFVFKQAWYRSKSVEFPLLDWLSILQAQSEIVFFEFFEFSLNIQPHIFYFLSFLNLGTEQTNCEFCPHILVWISFSRLTHYRSGKNTHFERKLGQDKPLVFLKNFLIFISFIFPFTGAIFPTPSQQIHTHLMTSNLFCSVFSERCQVSSLRLSFYRSLSSWPILILVSSEKNPTRYRWSTFHCLFPIHQASRLTSLITSFFFNKTLPIIMLYKLYWIVLLFTGYCLPSLNVLV